MNMAYVDRKNNEYNLSVIMKDKLVCSLEIDEKYDIGSFDENFGNINLLSRHCANGRNILYRSGNDIFSVTETIGNNMLIENITAELYAEFELIVYSLDLEYDDEKIILSDEFVHCFEPLDKNMYKDFIYTAEGNILYYSHTIENWVYFNFYD